jgi:hypothetical protein
MAVYPEQFRNRLLKDGRRKCERRNGSAAGIAARIEVNSSGTVSPHGVECILT